MISNICWTAHGMMPTLSSVRRRCCVLRGLEFGLGFGLSLGLGLGLGLCPKPTLPSLFQTFAARHVVWCRPHRRWYWRCCVHRWCKFSRIPGGTEDKAHMSIKFVTGPGFAQCLEIKNSDFEVSLFSDDNTIQITHTLMHGTSRKA